MDKEKLKELVKPVEPDLKQFDGQLASVIKNDSPLITSIAKHLMRAHGKRIRPAFLFLSSRAADFYTKDTVDASLAIELIHAATLLHDDVVDESDLRRGEKTVSSQWTNLVAVLMGDYLFAKAFRLMSDIGSIELMQAISSATERVSIGELRQIEETDNFDLSEEQYMSIIADKTASLFAVACEAGPILARKDENTRRKFKVFGEKIGVAFQIADDLLDFVGKVDITGKEPGNDVMTGKVTLPLIYTLQKGDHGKSREIKNILGDNGASPEGFKTILQYVIDSGGIEYAYKEASRIAHEGFSMIKGLADSTYYRSLSGMVEFSTTRAA